MPRGNSEDASILEYALRALEQERDNLQSKIDHIRRQLGGRKSGTASAPAAEPSAPKSAGRGKRVLSDEARKRIAAAQKKRWAAHRRGLKPSASKTASKAASNRATKKAATKKAALKKAEAASE